jgi:low temperature requirement protein LtrA
VIWGVAVGIEVLTPWVARRAMAVPMHASHLAERYGLFTIIVLGESVFGVVTGVDGTAWGGAAAATAVLGFVVAAGAWWLYFALAGRMEFGRSVAVRNTFVYGHLAIAVGLAAAGTGIKLAILRAPADELGTGPTWALAGGTALFLLTTALLAAVVARRPAPRPVVAGRTLAGALALLLAALGGGLPALAVTAVLAVLVVGVAAAELAAVPAVRPSGEPLVETGRA